MFFLPFSSRRQYLKQWIVTVLLIGYLPSSPMHASLLTLTAYLQKSVWILLALLDYDRLSLNLSHGFLSNCISWFPWVSFTFYIFGFPHVFRILEKKTFSVFYEYVSFSLNWDPMGAKASKCYSSLKSLLNLFKHILNCVVSVTKLRLVFLKF